MKKIIALFGFISVAYGIQAQETKDTTINHWIDSLFNTMNFDSFDTTLKATNTPKEITIKPALQKKYLPPNFAPRIGMTEKQIKKLRPGMGITKSVLYPKEKTTDLGLIKEVTYQFANNGVYEFIFQFSKSTTPKQVVDWATKKLGAPNSGDEWKFELKDGLVLKIWVFQNKYCVADSRQF